MGQLAEAYTGPPSQRDYRRLHSYDNLGRPSVNTIMLTDGNYTSRTDYDAWARVTRQTQQRGSSEAKSYGTVYNSFGHPGSISRNGVALWTIALQDASLRTRRASIGSRMTEWHDYNVRTGRLESAGLQTSSGVDKLLQGYQYDAIGNVTMRLQNWDAEGFQELFNYDPLNRLTSAQVVGQAAQAFTYSAAGNLVSKTGVGTGDYAYATPGANAVRPHAVQSIPGIGSFSYDANGNLQAGAGRSISWSSFDMPVQVSNGASSSTFVYGPEHQRVKQLRSDGTVILYAGAQEVETNSSSTVVRTYWPNGLGFELNRSSERSTNLFWTHRDRLDSPIALTSDIARLYFAELLAYDSWGKRRTFDGTATPDTLDGILDNKGFTGHEMLEKLELVHMNGRVYDPLVARFLSADPMLQDPSNGQSYNRYSYVLNNPTNLTDPTGFVTTQPEVEASIRKNLYTPTGSSIAQRQDILTLTLTTTISTAAGKTVEKDTAQTTVIADAKAGGGAAKGAEIQGINRSFEKAFGQGDVATMRDLLGSYQDITGGDPSSAMNVVRMSSAILKAEQLTGAEPDKAIVAKAAAAGFMLGMSGGGPDGSKGKPINLPSWKRIDVDMDHIASGHMAGDLVSVRIRISSPKACQLSRLRARFVKPTGTANGSRLKENESWFEVRLASSA